MSLTNNPLYIFSIFIGTLSMNRYTLFILFAILNSTAFAVGNKVVHGERPASIRFTENKGQWDSRVLFKSTIPGGNVLLEKDALYYFLYSDEDMAAVEHHPGSPQQAIIHAHAVRANFVGADLGAAVKGKAAFKDYANYYLGNDPAKWASGVQIYGSVAYSNVYTNVDLLVYSADAKMKYDFIVRKGGDAQQIKINYTGADKIALRKGVAYISTSVGDIMEQKPYAYQDINGVRKEVPCSFVLNGSQLSFAFPQGYNTAYTLVIDPTIVFSTYTGAATDNWGYTATYGNDGSMYLGGYVNEPPIGGFYPTTPGAFQLFFGGGTGSVNTPGTPPGQGNGIAFACDMGITKFTPNGAQLVYSTYLGGNDNETPHSLVVDAQDNLIIYGVAYSSNYPVTTGAYDASYNGDGDIVVTKLNAGGTALLGSTFIGGSAMDGLNFDPEEFTSGRLKRNYGDQNRGEVNIDAAGNIYVASCTQSSNYPVSPGAFQSAFGGIQDGCAFKVNANCSQLLWSTFLGGTSDDACYSLDLGPAGTVYVAGGTMSNNFPTTAGTIHSTYQGGLYDGFVALINATGSQLLASSYIGTSGNDQLYFVKLDGAGNVYFVGQTTGQYPVQNAIYANPNSGQFISKLNPQLNSVFYSTVFGSGSGLPNISPTAFLVDTCENVYVAGWGTNSASFTGFANNMFGMPITNDAIKSTTDGTDFYFIVLAKNASELLYGSYFGGDGSIEHVDGGTSRFDKRGVIYEAMCAGCGGNSLTPTTQGSWSPMNQSTNCNELGLKMEFNLSGTSVELDAFPRATGCVPLTVQFTGTITPGAEFTWYFGDGDTSQTQNPQHTYTDTGTYVVMLVGIDSNSCNISDTAYIDVWVRDDSLSANFAPNVIVDCITSSVSVSSHNYATTSYLWNMGDGTTYTTDSVYHVYASPGNYTITLTVTDSTKCNLSDAFSVPVTIQASVDANFVLSDSLGCVPLTISFNAALVNNVSYAWNFGDGTTSTQNAVTHTYIQPGTFTAQLIVTDPNSCNLSDTAFSIIEVIDSSAGADFNFTRTFFGCDSVQVTLWSTYIGEEFELWDFGDGFTSNADTVSHTYSTGGTYTITHFINDVDQICKPLDTSILVISLQPLDISVTIPDTIGCIPFTALFIGNSALVTTDYIWNFSDGTSLTGDTVTHTFSAVGTYSITVLGSDTNACIFYDTAFASITAINDSTIADFAATVLNSCDSSLVVQLSNQSINALEYIWNFGDGNTSNAIDTTYTYTLPGTYTITLTAIDTNRCHPVDTATFTVTMLPNSFVDFTVANVCLGTIMQFNNLGSPAAQYSWSFGDGATSTDYAPTHLYTGAGTYNVSVTIVDTTTCDVTSSVTKEVKVYLQPIAGFNVSNDTFRFETPVEFVNTSINYENLTWNFGDGTGATDEETPVHIYGVIYWVQVCLTAYNEACADTACKDIFISFDALIGVPNAFSPNGDGINDVIRVEGKGIIELEFRIFNRWGEKVFETNDKSVGWDGYYKGVLQEMEAYTYSVQAKFIDGTSKSLKGNITLLR